MTSFTRSLTPIISNTVQVVGSTRALCKPITIKVPPKLPQSFFYKKPITGNASSTISFIKPMSVRYAHTDVTVPDYDDYRPDVSKLSLKAGNFRKDEEQRRIDTRSFNYAMTAGVAIGGVYAAKVAVSGFIALLAPSKKVLAISTIEVNLDEIPEGKSVTFEWRGKPLFIRHRTANEIEKEGSVNVAELRDPQNDSDRVQRPEFLIVIGVCTHLGCIPIADAGDYGGYYCPCHGSHYDASGRIRKGPAPANLEVPEHTFLSDSLVRVG